jgi:hypothetical protein
MITTPLHFPCFPGLHVVLPVAQGYPYVYTNDVSVYLVQPRGIWNDLRKGTFLNRKGCEKPDKINSRLTYKYDA